MEDMFREMDKIHAFDKPNQRDGSFDLTNMINIPRTAGEKAKQEYIILVLKGINRKLILTSRYLVLKS